MLLNPCTITLLFLSDTNRRCATLPRMSARAYGSIQRQIDRSGLHKNILGRFSFIRQWAIKLAQCQVSASFWISLAANGNQPKSNQNTLVCLTRNSLLKNIPEFHSYAVSCQKLSSMYSNQILMKETRLESFSFTNLCLHPCENTVPGKVA